MNIQQLIKKAERLEQLPLALITMVGPWLTPLVPAYFVAVSIREFLQAPVYVAVVAGIVLEVVGLAGIATATRAYIWNKTKRKSDEESPLFLALVAVSVYFITALALTVIIEFNTDLTKIAPGMFVVLSISSGLILVLASMQRFREQQITEQKAEQREKRKRNKQVPVKSSDLVPAMMSNEAALILQSQPDISGSELGRRLGKSDSMGRRIKRQMNGK